MIRATTPTHTFRFGDQYRAEDFSAIKITYSQNDEIVLQKGKSDLTWDDNIATLKLTQQETNLFSELYDAEIQVRAKTTDGTVMAGPRVKRLVHDVLDDEVM